MARKRKADLRFEVDVWLPDDPMSGDFDGAILSAIKNEEPGARAKVKLKRVM